MSNCQELCSAYQYSQDNGFTVEVTSRVLNKDDQVIGGTMNDEQKTWTAQDIFCG